jgi:hypothetical protein
MTSAFVRVSGPPNSNFLVGYPGISATSPRIEGKVEIRPLLGVSAPVHVALVTVSLQRRETIHPSADTIKGHLVTGNRREITDLVGKEMLLYRAPPGRDSEAILSMDLPFVIFIPFGRGGEEMARRVPPASLQLERRAAETHYNIVVNVHHAAGDQKKHSFPVPITRYDTLSTFGMYNRPETAERVTDHLVTLAISLPRWSYGPLDPVSVYIKLSPNPDWLRKAMKVTLKHITISIEEDVIYNHQGDEPQRKVKSLVSKVAKVGIKLPEAGYFTNMGLIFPAKDHRNAQGILPRQQAEFPLYTVSGFTTTGTLYKIEYYLVVKV